jgi:glycosyltransferase involved in cell wall biosynthesis
MEKHSDARLRVFLMADHLGHADGRIHGGTTYFINAIPALARGGLDLTVVFMGPEHPAAEKLEEEGIHPHFLGLSKWDPRSMTAFHTLLDGQRHDVLHLHSMKAQLAGRLAARARGLPAVVHVHDHILMRQPLRFFQQSLASSTAALVGITDSVKDFAQRQYRVPEERCHTVPYGMDLSAFTRAGPEDGTAVREQVGTDQDRTVIVVLGRVIADKGQDRMIRAMPAVLSEAPDAQLWVVGDGPDREAFQQLARSLNLDDAVRFLGQRSDVPAVLAAGDVSVVPSMWQEGFGFVALESLAAGVPVVAYRSGGLPTTVKDGETGFLVEQGSIAGLSTAVLRLIEDPELRHRLGARGRDHALTFTPERHAERMKSVFRQAVELSPR